MTIDPLLAGAAFGIGIVVGLTGMGGGALMTPVLVLFFNVPPLTAVSSDLVASAVMKPVGSFVHLRRGTVHLGLVKWLCIGSVPGAFSGVLIARALGGGEQVQHVIRIALGVALLLAAAGLIVRAYIRLAEHARERDGRAAPAAAGSADGHPPSAADHRARRARRHRRRADLGRLGVAHHHRAHGAVPDAQGQRAGRHRPGPGGAAGRLRRAGPPAVRRLPPRPDHLAAAGLHPGRLGGAHLSARAPGGLVRRALAFVLLASALKLFNVSNSAAAITLAVFLAVGPILWMVVRRQHGFPAIARRVRQN